MAEPRPRGRTKARRDLRAVDVWRPAERPRFEGALLLDTHIWVWLLEGDSKRLAPATLALLRHSAGTGQLMVSDISVWEVANKSAKGKLVLSLDPVIWLDKAASAPGIHYLPLDRRCLIQSVRLPAVPPGDPADRMLIATAQLTPASLITCDEDIISYARLRGGLSVCDARK
jgi:PIN domain nuclease of toxin-antitoxin system